MKQKPLSAKGNRNFGLYGEVRVNDLLHFHRSLIKHFFHISIKIAYTSMVVYVGRYGTVHQFNGLINATTSIRIPKIYFQNVVQCVHCNLPNVLPKLYVKYQ